MISYYNFKIEGVYGKSGNLPIGNGDIGANVWIDEERKINLLLSKTDALSELTRPLKLGLVKIGFSNEIFNSENKFSSTLLLQDGCIYITVETNRLKINVYIDAYNPAIRFGFEADFETNISVEAVIWRTNATVDNTSYLLNYVPESERIESADVVCSEENSLAWYHHNSTSCMNYLLKNIDLEKAVGKFDDPILGMTFGCRVYGEGFIKKSELLLVSEKPVKKAEITILALTDKLTPSNWIEKINNITIPPSEVAFAAHKKYWKEFFERSYIYLSGDEDAEICTRGYIYQKYMNACAGKGKYPIKFNGSIFTCQDTDENGNQVNYDYRLWGAPYWIQNTRLIYWNLLYNGDFEMMKPFFNHMKKIIPLSEFSVKEYYGHKGIRVPETYSIFGTFSNSCYHFENSRENSKKGEPSNNYTRWDYNGQLEIALMMLEYYAYTNDEKFLLDLALPFTKGVLDFFDCHFEKVDGYIRLYPTSANETWQECVDNTPDLAGLKYVSTRLIAILKDKSEFKELIEFAERIHKQTRDIPVREVNGEKTIWPYIETMTPEPGNWENSELYAVFPYKIYGLGKKELEIARSTYKHKRWDVHWGWTQNATFASLLGLADEAKSVITQNFSRTNKAFLFTAFWGPNMDWTPDQDHGTQNSVALINMLMQCEDKEIRLLPAFPKEWNAKFKLFAPYKTVVEGEINNGSISYTVDPPSRADNIVVLAFL